MNEKEAEYKKTKGTTYMKRDDFKQLAAQLRVKNQQFKKMKKTLDEIRSELTVLTRTENILKSRADNIEELMANMEKEKGIQGYSKMEDKLEDISKNKEKLDNQKDQTL